MEKTRRPTSGLLTSLGTAVTLGLGALLNPNYASAQEPIPLSSQEVPNRVLFDFYAGERGTLGASLGTNLTKNFRFLADYSQEESRLLEEKRRPLSNGRYGISQEVRDNVQNLGVGMDLDLGNFLYDNFEIIVDTFGCPFIGFGAGARFYRDTSTSSILDSRGETVSKLSETTPGRESVFDFRLGTEISNSDPLASCRERPGLNDGKYRISVGYKSGAGYNVGIGGNIPIGR